MSGITGGCYCGSIKFKITAEKPLFASYCHCKECRVAHSAPIYATCCVKDTEFIIEQGQELLKDYFSPNHPAKLNRRFCSNCGSRVYNSLQMSDGGWLPAGNYVSTFQGLFDNNHVPDAFKPTNHLFTKEAIVDVSKIDDGLPK